VSRSPVLGPLNETGSLRRWITLVVLAIAAFAVQATGTTSARAATFVYDAPAAPRAVVHEVVAAEPGLPQVVRSLEGSASPLGEARGTSTTPLSTFVATNTVDDLVDLTTPGARSHILDGEVRPNGTYSGGHRPGTGFPGKSEFPSGWSDGRILHEISDIATDPSATRIVQGSRTVVTGTRDGVDIRVVIDNTTGEIVTGYPTNMPINP
jgi:hypothetical protein